MGDALGVQERDLLALGEPGPPGRARLLKAGHHGSRGASDPEWVAALAPDLVLVSAGRRNPFDHPHAEAMAALRSCGARVFVTGTRQGLLVEAAAEGWTVAAGDGARFCLASSAAAPGLGPGRQGARDRLGPHLMPENH